MLSPEAYDQLFSMHGITMIFLFVTPMLSGFGNYFVPLHDRRARHGLPAAERARLLDLPRRRASSSTRASLIGKAPDDGWFNYAPLSLRARTGPNIDFYGLGLIFLGLSSTAGAINFIVTIFSLRAPGMSINRMPLFCWAMLATSFSIIFALPSLTRRLPACSSSQRKCGFHFFDTAHGGDPLLWQHLFWIFGHPDVYIIFLPAVGIVSTIMPVFSRRPIVALPLVALATMATGLLGFGVWVHHMFAIGLPQLSMTFFAAASMAIAIPSGIQIFAWLATIIGGRPVMRTPFLFVLGFIVVFVIGGLSGVMFAVISFDQQVTDSYFVVAHFHYVLFGGAVFPILAAHPLLAPEDERPDVQRAARPSRASGSSSSGSTSRSSRCTSPGCSACHGGSTPIPSHGLEHAQPALDDRLVRARVRDPADRAEHPLEPGAWASPPATTPGAANTLEWSTCSPPPAYNFATIPVVRSANPNWDVDDRAEDRARLERGELVYADGHETVATSEVDANLERLLRMPADSPWPLAVAAALTIFFVGLIARSNIGAWVGVALILVTLAGWHFPWSAEEDELA